MGAALFNSRTLPNTAAACRFRARRASGGGPELRWCPAAQVRCRTIGERAGRGQARSFAKTPKFEPVPGLQVSSLLLGRVAAQHRPHIVGAHQIQLLQSVPEGKPEIREAERKTGPEGEGPAGAVRVDHKGPVDQN